MSADTEVGPSATACSRPSRLSERSWRSSSSRWRFSEGDVDVVSEVLDREVVDRNGRQMGRVDGIVLDIGAGEPPRVAALVVGPSALAYRLHPRLGRLMKAIEIRLGLDSRRPT